MNIKQGNLISERESFVLATIRIGTTTLIVLCHIFSEIQKLASLGQIFNVGIYVFFALSGYLYGKKTIDHPLQWIKRQLLKLMIPYYIYFLLSYALLVILGKNEHVDILSGMIMLLNLQGFVPYHSGGVVVTHLWFMSHIMVCYLLTPLFQKIKLTSQKRLKLLIPVAIIVCQLLLSIVTKGGNYVHLAGILIYYVFYTQPNITNYTLKTNVTIWLTFAAGTAVIGRFLFIILDLDKIAPLIYEIIIVPYSHLLFGAWIFVVCFILLYKVYSCVAIHRFGCLVRTVSYYCMDLYIVHYMALVGSFSGVLRRLSKGVAWRYYCACIVFWCLSTVLLHFISKKTQARCNKQHCK